VRASCRASSSANHDSEECRQHEIGRAPFQATDEEFHAEVAKTGGEIKGLLEVGFEYVCEKDALVYLRKRK